MKRRTVIGGIGSVLTAFASLGCYGLASDQEDSSEGDGASNNNSDQNDSQTGSDGSGDSAGSENSTSDNESGESNESNESDTSPDKPDENESTSDYDMRDEQKAREAEPVPEAQIDISVTSKRETKDGIQIKGEVSNQSSTPITFVDVELIFEDGSGGYLHTEVCTVRTIGPNGSEPFKATVYYQQLPGEVGNVEISIADSGRIPEETA